MHFRTSSTFALLAAALTLGAAAEASAQQIPRGGKEPPCVCDTVRVTRVDTVTVWRRDTVRVTQYDTVRVEPVPVVIPPLVGGPYVGLGGGLTFPQGDFGNYEMGWNATGMFGYDFRTNPFGWRIDASYDQFAEQENTAGGAADPTLWTINGDLKFRIPFGATRRSHIYALGGVTYGRYKDMIIGPQTDARWDSPSAPVPAGLDVSTIDNWTDEFGWNAGGGVSFGLGRRTNLFVESRFIDLEGSFVPLIAGLTWTLGS
ncbi:MAG TPA: outer membrane beta-barrel protein [Gemmatimonadaceae bacterium]|nr:outer membrane beta-barrel protein [Gemmatimonadaceae bacterium]